jgi:hypothetical protein
MVDPRKMDPVILSLANGSWLAFELLWVGLFKMNGAAQESKGVVNVVVGSTRTELVLRSDTSATSFDLRLS